MERINSLEEKLESERKKSRARDNILRGQIMKSQSSSGIQNRVDDEKVARLSAAAAAAVSDDSDIKDQSFVENFIHGKFESTKKHVVNSGKEYLDNVFEYLKSNSHSPFEKQENNTKDNNSISVVEKNHIEETNNNVLVTTTNPPLVTHNVNTNKSNATVVEETLSQTDQDDEEERRIEKSQRSLPYWKHKLYKLLSFKE